MPSLLLALAITLGHIDLVEVNTGTGLGPCEVEARVFRDAIIELVRRIRSPDTEQRVLTFGVIIDRDGEPAYIAEVYGEKRPWQIKVRCASPTQAAQDIFKNIWLALTGGLRGQD